MATRRTSHCRIPKPHYSACFNIGKYFKSTAKTTSTPYLPPEMVEIILSRLPVKALLRFKAVSKSWNTTISDPAFVRNHHHISNSHDLFLCQLKSKESLRLVKLEDRKLETVETQKSPHDGAHVLCVCDGVLLFSVYPYGSGYLLWNPSAGTETRFDIPSSLLCPYSLGVCQDPTDDDEDGNFKVVVVSIQHYAIYSCDNRSWSDVKQLNVVTRPSSRHESGISVDGAIYWVFWPRDDNNNRSCCEITYYDPRDDKFKILQKPKDVGGHKWIGVADLRGSLCLYWYGTDMQTVRIWAKEKGIDKNRWEVLMIIIHNVDMPSWTFQPQCWFGNKIVFRSREYYSLMVYSPLENKFEQFEELTRVYGPGLIPYIPLRPIKSTRPKRQLCFSIGNAKSTSKRTSTPDLPCEIAEIILSRLSVKALLRFKAVSKSWNTIISDPVFIRNHHHISKSRNSPDLFLCDLVKPDSGELLCLVKLEDRKLETVETDHAPHDCRHVSCFCDGVLLYEDHQGRYVVWNPSARTEITIPFNANNRYTVGVCQDPTTDDFKVVVVCHCYYAVYSCNNRSWNNIKQVNVAGTRPSTLEPGISVDGAIYWVFWRRRKNNTSCRGITYYDPRNDKFKILQKPKGLGDDKAIYLVDLGGSLCVYCYGTNMQTVQIWTKEKGKNCWEVLIIIHDVDMPRWSFQLQPQCLLGNKILLRNNYDRSLVVYSPLENKFEQFEGTKLNGLGLIPYIPLPIKSTRKPKKLKGLHNILIDLLRLNSCF